MPARLTALLLALSGMAVGRSVGWRGLRQDARVTLSPNGGWPMGAMARLLGVRLGKPGVYVLNPGGAFRSPPNCNRPSFMQAVWSPCWPSAAWPWPA